MQIARVGARYVLNALTLGLSYSNVQYGHDGLSKFSETEKLNSGAFFFDYRFTAVSSAGLAYNYTRTGGAASASYSQLSFSYDYELSKITGLYVIAAYQSSSGTTLNSAGQVIAANASIASYGINSGTDTQAVAIVGIIHRF